MSFSDPKLTAQLTIPSAAAAWGPKTGGNGFSSAIGNENGGTLRASIVDGQLSSEYAAKQQSNYGAAIEEQYRVAGMGIEYAVNPHTQSRIAPYELQDDSIVFIPGHGGMSFESAKQAGFVASSYLSREPGERGTEVQPRPTEASQQQPKQETNADLQGEPLADPAAEQTITMLVENTGGTEQLAAIEQIIETGEINSRTLGTLASQLRVEPEQLQAQFAPIMRGMEQQARAVMSAGGLDSNDVVAWAQKNRPDMLNRAMHQQATMRSTTGYAEIRQSYRENLADHNPSAALSADLGPGITQRQDSKGRIIVRLPDGAEVEWSTAIAAFGPR